MSEKLPIAGLIVLSGCFALVGALALFAPHLVAGPVEIGLPSPSANAEFRAGYGGVFGGLAFLFATGARKPEHRPLALGVAAVVLGLFSSGRALSWALDGPPNAYSNLMHGLETVGCVLAVVLWAKSR